MGAAMDACVHAHVQAQCPDLLTPTDLLFLEPRCLIVEDPLGAWPGTWPAIRRVAEGIDRLMRENRVYKTPFKDYRMGKIKDEVHFCDAVPVSRYKRPSQACSTCRPLQHVPSTL